MKRSMHFSLLRRMSLVLLGVFLLVLLVFNSAYAAGGGVTIQFTPDSLEILPGGEATTNLLITNSSSSEIKNIRLDYDEPEQAALEVMPKSLDSLPAGNSAAIQVKIKNTSDFSSPKKVYFQISYQFQSAPDAAESTAIQFVPLTLNPAAITAAVLKVSAATSGEEISETQPGDIYLSIENDSSQNAEINQIKTDCSKCGVENPENEVSIQTDQEFPIKLAPYDSILVHYRVILKGQSAVKPGKLLTAFNIEAYLPESKREISAALSQTVTLGVMGESEIVKLLGIPSLLFLPGFLMLATMILMAKVLPIKRNGTQILPEVFTLVSDAKNIYFWLISISLSILCVYFYPKITSGLAVIGWVSGSRNLLVGYGLTDLFVLWVGSVLVGFLIIVIIRLVFEILLQRENALLITGSEEVIEFLQKLAGKGESITQRLVQYKIGTAEYKGFLYTETLIGTQKDWLFPYIFIDWMDASYNKKQEIASLLDSRKKGSFKRLVWLLTEEIKKGTVRIKWQRADGNTPLRSLSPAECDFSKAQKELDFEQPILLIK